MHSRFKLIVILAFSFYALFACSDKQARNEKNSLSELQGLELSALRYAMKAHADSGKEKDFYRYYVIDRREFLKDFEGILPTVALADNERFGSKNGVFQELTTGKNAKLWENGEAQITQESASVLITWYSASLAAGLLEVKLERINGKWIAKSIVDGPIS
jgi:hypothetical protein